MGSELDKSGEWTETVGQKLDTLSASVDKRFDTLSASVDKRFDTMSASVDERFDAVESGPGRTAAVHRVRVRPP